MKRRDLLKQIARHAKANGLPMTTTEGGSHTMVTVGDSVTVVPRHREIDEITAKAILKQIGSTEMKITAVARRSGGWWAIHVPEVSGVFTQARRLDQVAHMAADAAALVLDTDPATFEVEVEPHTDVDSLIAQAREAREVANRAASEASEVMRRAARGLVADGLTVRDVGRLLDVSPQRISQLVS